MENGFFDYKPRMTYLNLLKSWEIGIFKVLIICRIVKLVFPAWYVWRREMEGTIYD